MSQVRTAALQIALAARVDPHFASQELVSTIARQAHSPKGFNLLQQPPATLCPSAAARAVVAAASANNPPHIVMALLDGSTGIPDGLTHAWQRAAIRPASNAQASLLTALWCGAQDDVFDTIGIARNASTRRAFGTVVEAQRRASF
jgi:hypothetical protein